MCFWLAQKCKYSFISIFYLQDNSSTGDVTVSNGNELNGNGDIPSLKDLSAEAAAVIDAVNGK